MVRPDVRGSASSPELAQETVRFAGGAEIGLVVALVGAVVGVAERDPGDPRQVPEHRAGRRHDLRIVRRVLVGRDEHRNAAAPHIGARY